MRLPADHRLLPVGPRMAARCDPARRRLQRPVRTCPAKCQQQQLPASQLAAQRPVTTQSAVFYDIPGIRVPGPDPIYCLNVNYKSQI